MDIVLSSLTVVKSTHIIIVSILKKHLIIFPFLCGTFFSYWKLQTNIDIYKNFNFSVLGR